MAGQNIILTGLRSADLTARRDPLYQLHWRLQKWCTLIHTSTSEWNIFFI